MIDIVDIRGPGIVTVLSLWRKKGMYLSKLFRRHSATQMSSVSECHCDAARKSPLQQRVRVRVLAWGSVSAFALCCAVLCCTVRSFLSFQHSHDCIRRLGPTQPLVATVSVGHKNNSTAIFESSIFFHHFQKLCKR